MTRGGIIYRCGNARNCVRGRCMVNAALELFTEQGGDMVTLDGLRETLERSKRTFFRQSWW